MNSIFSMLRNQRHYPIGLTLRRMRHEWRLLGLLLFAISLITGFFALGPLYIRTVTEVDLRFALGNAEPDELLIEFISTQELDEDAQADIEQNVGELVTNVERYYQSEYSPAAPAGAQGAPGAAGTSVCGFVYSIGINPILFPSGASGNCYQAFAYENLDEKVQVVEGRLPVRGPTPAMFAELEAGLSDAELQEQYLGNYRRYEIETVITSIVAEEANLEIGSRFFIGNLNPNEAAVSRVVVVGIVEPVDSGAFYWSGMVLNGASIPIDNIGTLRFDFGLLFHPDAYKDWIEPVLPQNVSTNYFWEMEIDSSLINSDNAETYRESISSLSGQLSNNQRVVLVNSGLEALLGGYDNRVSETTGPIVLLSGAVLILMLYHLVTTVSLVLQEQGREWSTITSRGGSTLQLFELQAVTIFILALIAAVIGPLISRTFMIALEQNGPLADALAGTDTGTVSLPNISYYLSAAAAAAALVVLTLPSIPAARQSLLRLKQFTSRPPTMPPWTKFFLDILLIVVGFALLMRLYWTVSNETDFGTLINDLIEQPNEVIKFVADNATQEGGLSDPFNLIAPALVLTGFALFWLRLFPLIMKGVSRFTSRSNMLATPMAIWNVERNPGHYSQLVLLLIGTLALGTASLGLQQTRDVGGWNAAQLETGGAANVEINPNVGRYDDYSWDRFDGIETVVPVMRETGRRTIGGSNREVTLLGLDADAFAEAFPDYADDVEALYDVDVEYPGLELPTDAARLQVQVWSASNVEILTGEVEDQEDPIVVVNAYVVDAHGVPYAIDLTQPTANPDSPILPETPTDQWITFSGELPSSAIMPLRLWRVGIQSRMGDVNFSHTVLLDFWQTVDVNGTATQIADQENPEVWQHIGNVEPFPRELTDPFQDGLDAFDFVSTVPGGQAVFDGQNALQFDYSRLFIRNNEPGLALNPTVLPAIPAIVSEDFTTEFRIAQRTDAPNLQIGDVQAIPFAFETGSVNMTVEVVGIVEEFMTLDEVNNRNGIFFIVPIESSRVAMNQALLGRSSKNAAADINNLWLSLEDRRPTDTLEEQLGNIDAVTEVAFAWDRFSEILREPLPSGVAGMLFAGFWISFILSLLDFAFYIAVTAKQRSFTFGVLRSLGWNSNNIWQMLLVEQIALVLPALIVGSLLGAGLAYLLLPFLSLVGGSTLRIPLLDLSLLIATLVGGFVILLVFTALWLRQMSVNQVLRLGEE